MKNYDVILFDLNDTLVNDTENRRFAYQCMIEYFGFPYSEEGFLHWLSFDNLYWKTYVNHVSVPSEFKHIQSDYVWYIRSYRYFMFFNGKISLKDALAYNELYIKSLEKHIVSMPNAFEMISFLWNHYLLYIATDGPKQAVPSKLNAIGCSSFFQGIFSRNMTKSNTAKPNPLFFEDLLEYIHFDKKDRILIVGDNLEKDIALASNVQVDSCWYNHKQEVSTTIIPTYEIHDLLELKRILS